MTKFDKYQQTGRLLERELLKASKNLLQSWATSDTDLPRDAYRQATTKEDTSLGTDLFLFNTPIDITEKSLSMKDSTEDLHHTMTLSGEGGPLLVNFGIRYGNNYRGTLNRFNVPVLTLGIQDYGEEKSRLNHQAIKRKRSREEMAHTVLRQHFDDVIFTGQYLYNKSVKKHRQLIVVVSGESKGALYTDKGKKWFINSASQKSGIPTKDIELYPAINPHVDTLYQALETHDVMAFAIAERPDDSMSRPGYIYYLTPDELASEVHNTTKSAQSTSSKLWDLVIDKS